MRIHMRSRKWLIPSKFYIFNKYANKYIVCFTTIKEIGVGQRDLVSIYCSIIRSRVEYAAPAWSNLTVGLSQI